MECVIPALDQAWWISGARCHCIWTLHKGPDGLNTPDHPQSPDPIFCCCCSTEAGPWCLVESPGPDHPTGQKRTRSSEGTESGTNTCQPWAWTVTPPASLRLLLGAVGEEVLPIPPAGHMPRSCALHCSIRAFRGVALPQSQHQH